MEFQEMVPTIREKGFYPPEEQRGILWREYTTAQIEDAHETLDFIRDSVDNAKPLKNAGKAGKPLTDPKALAKAVLACEALGFAERAAQGWLRILGPFLGIREDLDDRTIGDAYDKVEILHILKQVFDATKSSDGRLCGDGTGLETSRKRMCLAD